MFEGVEGDLHISTIRSLVLNFGTGLEGHLFGSPRLVSKQMDTVGDLLEFISERRPRTLADSEEDSITFMDLPRELILIILRYRISPTTIPVTKKIINK